jgi:U-box domain
MKQPLQVLRLMRRSLSRKQPQQRPRAAVPSACGAVDSAAAAAQHAAPAWQLCPLSKVRDGRTQRFKRCGLTVSVSDATAGITLPAWPAALHRAKTCIFANLCACCTQAVMIDPVLLPADAHIYERAAITAWLQQHGTSPLTGQPADATSL